MILIFYPSWIPDPRFKKAPDPVFGTATLVKGRRTIVDRPKKWYLWLDWPRCVGTVPGVGAGFRNADDKTNF
jgi:hypothetical protein